MLPGQCPSEEIEDEEGDGEEEAGIGKREAGEVVGRL